MDDCFNKRLTTRDGDTYAYDYVPAKENKATFFLIHGYPSSRHDWRYQVTDLTEAGYGVIAPDCLGYGDSDKRIDIEAYRLKRLSGHFVELLDHENIDKVVGVSHDWGSMVLSRVVVWHPERFIKLVFMSAGYTAPGVFFDVDGLNVWSQSQLGYMQLGYWYFFNSYDAEDVIIKNLESFFHLAYPNDNSIWVKSLAAINGTREWLTAGKTGSLPPWLDQQDKDRWLKINSQKNTIAASLNYYKSLMRGTQAPDEDTLTDAQRILNVPVLGICGSDDMVTRADQIGGGIRPYSSKGYTEMVLEGAGHWVMLEKRKEVSNALLDFVRSDSQEPQTDENVKKVGVEVPASEAKEDGIAFWTRHTKPVLTSLLKDVGSYTEEQQASHLQFLEEYIIPSMGPAPEKERPKSLLTPNGSPFETSINHSDNGKSSVRFCYEPVFPGSGAGGDVISEDPIPGIAEKAGADMRWFNQFAAAFFPSMEDDAALIDMVPKTTIRVPKVFLAFDLEEDKRSMKAYFYPVIKYMTSKINSDRAGFDLIRRLDPLGSSFRPAIDMIENYQKQLYGDPPLTLVIGIDCVTPEAGARIKIYIEPRTNSWAAVQQHVTLGGQLSDKKTTDGLAILRDMWNLMIDEPEDKEIDDNFEKEIPETSPKSSGACFSWELKPGEATPDIKIYVALPSFFKSDKAIAEAMEKIFRKRGWAWGVEGAYQKVVSDAFGSDVVDDAMETPKVHSFISFNFSEKKGVYMTTYAAPFVRFS